MAIETPTLGERFGYRVMIMGFFICKTGFASMEMVALPDDNHVNCIPNGGSQGRALRDVFSWCNFKCHVSRQETPPRLVACSNRHASVG